MFDKNWKDYVQYRREEAGLPFVSDIQWERGMFMIPRDIWFWMGAVKSQYTEDAWLKKQLLMENGHPKPAGLW